MRIDMVSEHANPLAVLGGVDSGGQNVYVAALAEQLAIAGHEVTVHTRRDDPAASATRLAPGGYTVELLDAGPARPIPKDDIWRHLPELTERLARRWEARRPDLVHAHFWMSGVAAAAALGRGGPGTGGLDRGPLRVPLVQTFHALGAVKRRHQGEADTSPPERPDVELGLARTVDRILATCNDEVDELRAMGVQHDRVSIVPCGVDTSVFTPAPPRAAGAEPALLALGRLVERKGVDDIVTALAALPGVQLLIAGGGDDGDADVARLRALAARLGCADRVRFLGPVERDEVPRVLAAADVVVCVPWYEPFGIVPLEAMACGRPVVGSDVGGLKDTVVPGVTGERVPPRRPDALARTLSELLADPARCAAYGRAGVERVERLYRWEQVAARTQRVYDNVVAEHAATRVTEAVL
ncbi:MAG: Glycosyl transferase, group 1 [uncultured Nocardioidaceae bacterium]|uniref:Glycosyl transferase, group 1 n=1 Tax=uncultured Nocardioidaceae bacterium TaxID=253824 RepID=A0A6J4M0E6_9ACTN|nr:MAG: Glycosyl transferase, group 1 [uncultured Nocardioidaceae bacterium]